MQCLANMMNFPYLKFVVLFVTTVNCELSSNVIDVDDILAEDYMPGTLLVLENPTSGVNHFNGSLKNVETLEKIPDGSFGNAMETMNFHRSMMNQYLCRNFVAEQIIKDMTTSRVNRRMGHITPGSEPSKFKSAAENNLINDEGSSNYKNWLSKSTTLEDIYRHYDQAHNRIDTDIIEEEDKGEDFDEEYNGHVTGYVHPQGHDGQSPVKHRGHTGLGTYYAGGGGYPYPNAVYHHHGGGSDYHHGGGSAYQHGGGYHYSGGSGSHSHGGDSGYHHSAGGSGGYSHDGEYGEGDYSHHDSGGGGHSSYSGGHAVVETVYHSSPPKYQGQHETTYGGKDHDLSDLFDIALTALAFLSFGLFIVHVIMCISAANSSSTTTAASMMMPMSMSPTATATGTGNDGGGSTTSAGGGGAGGGTPSTGTGTGGATGGGSTGMGDGDTGTGNSGNTGAENTGTGVGDAGTGGGDIDGGGGGTDTTGTGGGDAGTAGGDTGGGNTDSASPGTGTGTGDGTTADGTTGTGTGEADTGSGRDTFKFRLRRDIPTITNPDNQLLNELARRVLTSIEAALVAPSDDGVCLRKSLCENNKYSRDLVGKDKIIIPVWSLGMSWLAGRLVRNVGSATSMLDTLKAAILGLGKANCEIIYQDCDLRRERRKRRRRRRKRCVTCN